MNVSLPARMALPGWVSLAFPDWAAAAKQWGLWNGLTNVGFLDILATNGPQNNQKLVHFQDDTLYPSRSSASVHSGALCTNCASITPTAFDVRSLTKAMLIIENRTAQKLMCPPLLTVEVHSCIASVHRAGLSPFHVKRERLHIFHKQTRFKVEREIPSAALISLVVHGAIVQTE